MNEILNNYTFNPIVFTPGLNPMGRILFECSKRIWKTIAAPSSKLELRKIEIDPSLSSAAITIQKIWRDYCARKGYLSSPDYATCKVQCEIVNDTTPIADGGTTEVYLPIETPGIVLKKSGRDGVIDRFEDMQTVRAVLRSKACSHLIVPKVRLCGEFLVEERLPISIDRNVNMGLYVDNLKAFDSAVREITRLFSEIYLTDLVSSAQVHHPIIYIAGVQVRHDNLPLYMEDGVGKIGLIDLEHIHTYPKNKTTADKIHLTLAKAFPSFIEHHGAFPLQTLAKIFPYHVEMIINESKKLKMKFVESQVRSAAKLGCKTLERGYIDYRRWLEEKKITPETASQPFEITLERLETLIQTVSNKMAKKSIPWMTPTLVNESVRVVILIIKGFLNRRSKEVLTTAELLTFRSPFFFYGDLRIEVVHYFTNKYSSGHWDLWINASQELIDTVFNELVNGGEIFSYHFLEKTNKRHKRSWIRY